MESAELSDLEEGEILENENDSPSNVSISQSEGFGSLKNQCKLIEGCGSKKSEDKNTTNSSKVNGSNNNKISDRSGRRSNPDTLDLDLEEVSSDGDCLSDNDWKHSSDSLDYKICQTKRSQYGTADDIMSEIGETLSRKKSRSSHKKRKSKYSFDNYKDNYNLWHHKASHTKPKKFRRRIDPDKSKSDEILTQGRKRKTHASYTVEQTAKKPKIRDFDEMRQTLLEKLRKQKAEQAKATVEVICLEEVENSEIQEVEMSIDNTNYVDSPALNDSYQIVTNEREKNKEENDDLDLIELRLAALKSNKKHWAISGNQSEAKNNNERSKNGNLDRYELLLRAEALKTALLKKHQKRLNKGKEMSSETNDFSNNNILNTILPLRGESCYNVKPNTSSPSNMSITEENTQREVESEIDGNTENSSVNEIKVTTTPFTDSLNLKKAKTKRKKRRSESLQNNAKENTENTEVFEEDDRTLRSQLLSDLLKKKSLKYSDKKPVLTDSVQISANQLPVISCGQPEEKGKPLATASKKDSSENVNSVNATKPAAAPRIPKPEIQRIIVHLGSEDSSDEIDTEENSPSKGKECKQGNVSTKELKESVQANYEKSVDLLLSQTWQKIESEIAAAKNAHNTPEAVYKHLPLSQRLEYIRLKQKIAERETLKKMKENSEKPSSGLSNQASTPCGERVPSNSATLKKATAALSKSDNCKRNTDIRGTGVVSKNVPSNSKNVVKLNQVNAKQKTLAVSKTNIVKNSQKSVRPNGLNDVQVNQRRLLLQSSQTLISKLKILLKKIKIDKAIEENYEKQICKLKNQIDLFEKKKLEQKIKIKHLAEESLKTCKLIYQITNLVKKPNEKPVEKKKCGVGESKNEKTGKVTEEPSSEEIVKVAEESEYDISKVKGKTDEEPNKIENVSSFNAGPLDYNSPLLAFNKVSDNSNRVDPNVMVCQFDLMGVCKDEECTYQHFRSSQSLHCGPVAGKPIQDGIGLQKMSVRGRIIAGIANDIGLNLALKSALDCQC